MREPTGHIALDASHIRPGHVGSVAVGGSGHSDYGQDDEEELKWSALERLNTFDRLRTGILNKVLEEGKVKLEHVDVTKMTHDELAKLVEQALETTDQDNRVFLEKFRQRLDRVGLGFPTVELRYENLCATAGVYVGNRALPTLVNFTRNMIESFLISLRILPSSKRDFPILHSLTGVIKPGRMTLLLGPPGAGKSTFMKYLAGKLDTDLKGEGTVLYNGHTMDEFVPVRVSAYISQNDNHIGEMTVRETLDFSARVQGAGFRTEMVKELERREKEKGIKPDYTMDAFFKGLSVEGQPHNLVTEYIIKVLSLEICVDIVVGNEMLRGISGGQKKRVTTGEMIVGPKQVLLMDEISTGLDSSTTFLITQCLRNITHLQDATTLIALLQPAPETYDLFDDILLLAEGHIIFHGPREDVNGFFEAVGFRCPDRKGFADFLQEVTSIKDQAQYWTGLGPYKYVPAATFSEIFYASAHGQAILKEMKTPFDKEKSHRDALVKEPYGLPKSELFKAVFKREALLMKRNAFLYMAMSIQAIIVGLVTMTLFFRTTLNQTIEDGSFYLGALFFGLIMMLFNGFSEMTLLVMRLPVFYKQRDLLLFPPWAISIPMWLLSIPFSAWASLVWGCLVYYVIGFTPEADRFFKYLLVLFMMHQMAIAIFRVIGSAARNMVVANTFGSMAVIVLFCLGGFIIAKNYIHPYWIWGFWISPIAYAMNCFTINEFTAKRWQKPAGDLYPGQSVGDVILSSRGLFKDPYMYWVGIAAMIGFTILFNAVALLFLTTLSQFGKPQPLLSEDTLAEKHAARTGENVESFRDSALGGKSHKASYSRRSALEKYRATTLASHSQLSDSVLASTSRLSSYSGLGLPPSGSGLGGGPEGISTHGSALSQLAMAEDGAMAAKGMVLPFLPLSLSFENVNYSVNMPSEMKAEGATESKLQLLRNVSGAFRPGVLTALVGVSGAGKTTLMDVLAGRKTGGYIEGDIRVSGYPKIQTTFARIMGYCEQTDIHTPSVTIHESLLYSAWLRLPSDVSQEIREAFVQEVMDLVELTPLQGAMVGLPGETGLSTEQRKRLTIAVELVANPSIIFMDEPTSGLDARAAAIVMRTVRNTVDTGRTVVCTIHQPSIDIFEAFDELLLMKRGGQVIYMGPLGKRSQFMVDYFQAIHGVPLLHEGQNPATWMLEISNPAAADRIGVDFAEIFTKSDQYKRNMELIESLKTPPDGHEDLAFSSKYSTPFGVQLVANLWKRRNMYWRSPEYNVVRYFYCLCIALLCGSVFFGLGIRRHSQQNILNVMGALYTCSLFLGWSNGASVQPIVSIERSVFYRERAAGMYSAIPYALAQGLVEIPYVLVQSLLYCIVTYALIHFEWTAPKFFWFNLYIFITLLYFTYYGMMAISITPNQQLAMVVSAFFFSLWNLFSGFLITRPNMPPWWRWYYWCNPIAWTLYGLIESQLGDVKTTLSVPGQADMPTVEHFLQDYLGYVHGMLGWVVAVQLAFMVLFFLVFAYALQKLNFQSR